MKPRHLDLIVALSSVLALAACGTSAPTAFYTLAAVPVPAQGAAPAPLHASIAVAAVTIPGVLDRPQLVRFSGQDRIQVAEQERWAEPLAHAIGRTLAEDLRARLDDPLVAAYPQDASAQARYRISVDFSHLDVLASGEVILDAQWSIRDATPVVRTSAPASTTSAPAPVTSVANPATRMGHAVLTVPAQGAGASAAVDAQNVALARLADLLAGTIRQFVEETQGSS